jgi:G6PDH family F420-dependent oxidoreductase
LAGEEHSASNLVRHGAMAEEVGFSFLFVSDHFHPWNRQQGHGSSVWPVLGSLCTSTSEAILISAVTCPILRFHITTLAQAAATVQTLSDGRFVLGLGTGENLNEHVAGEGWPAFSERLERLEEAVELLRDLLSGREVTRRGKFFAVERAQLFDAPDKLPVALAASGPKAAVLAGRLGDALISLGDDHASVQGFEQSGGQGKTKLTQISVCWAKDESEARRTAHRLWPVVALDGHQFAALETPADFEAACQAVTEDEVAAAIVCGPDPQRYKEAIRGCLEAGFNGVAIHQIGPDQEGFFEFWQRELKAWVAELPG